MALPLPRFLQLGLAVLLALGVFQSPAFAAPSSRPDSYIVVLQDGIDARAVAREHVAAHGLEIRHVYRHALKGYSARIPAARLGHIRADGRVRLVAPNGVVRLLSKPGSTTGDKLPTGVNRIDADVSPTAKINSNNDERVDVGVAILDTGIQSNHPDLNVAGGTNCLGGTSYEDGHGHGTHVAGTVGALDNGTGVVGVAPGARLYAVKVFDDGGNGTWENVICGIDWVTANVATLGIQVANMSLGDVGSDDGSCGSSNDEATDAMHAAICNSVAAGVTYVAAAGNGTKDLSTFVPAAYDEVIAVTAMTDFDGLPGGKKRTGCLPFYYDDTAAAMSNFTTIGSSDVGHTIAAPGICIESTTTGSSYTTKSGTSMASPHVAGAAALCIAGGACSGLGPSGITATLLETAASQPSTYGFKGDPYTPNGNRYYGHLVYAGGY